MASAGKREASPKGTVQALGRQVLQVRTLFVACAAVLVLSMPVAGAAPSPSMTVQTRPFCRFFVNQKVFDLCAAWQGGNRPPTYQVHNKSRRWRSCEEYRNDEWEFGKTFPQPINLHSQMRRSISVHKVGSRYRIRYAFQAPRKARIDYYPPIWEDITEAQIALLKKFYALVIQHEFGHKNILAALSRSFAYSGLHVVHLGPAASELAKLNAAWKIAIGRANDAQLELVQWDNYIQNGKRGYDELTAHGRKQSVVGGRTTQTWITCACRSHRPSTPAITDGRSLAMPYRQFLGPSLGRRQSGRLRRGRRSSGVRRLVLG